MRPLKPNSKGIFVPTANKLQTTGQIHAFNRKSNVLTNLDKVLKGEKPRLLLSRSSGGGGDVLMTLPTVKAISKKYDCKIDYATDFKYLEGMLPKVLQGNPYINQVLPWRGIDYEEYNAVIDLACPCVAHEKPLAPPINRIDLFARHAGIKLEDTTIDYYLTEKEKTVAREYLESNNLDNNILIMVQPFSSTPRRDAILVTLQRALTKLLAAYRNVQILIMTHDTDKTSFNWKSIGMTEVRNKDIREIAALMHYCDLIICPDSALLHLAGALEKKTVALFGPTDPRARVDHYPNAVAIWPGQDLSCSPCWYSLNKCGDICWKRLEEQMIVGVAKAMLEDKPLPLSRDLVAYGPYVQSNKLYEVL